MDSSDQATRTVIGVTEKVGHDQASRHLELMDRLDFQGWNAQDWDVFGEVHGPDVVSIGFGRSTTGIAPHVDYLQPIRAAHPEFVIESHPIRIAAGDWTVVTGRFTNGQTMATVARWADDQIAEEYVFVLDEG